MWERSVETHFPLHPRSPLAGHLALAASDAARRLLLPAVRRDVLRLLTERAEEHAISVFGANLRGLLTRPPLPGQTVLGLDPGYRTGCKVAVVDPTGRVLDTATIYPHPPQRKRAASLQTLRRLIARHRVTLVAIGNGTASRETEELAAELTRESAETRYVIVDEAGASVYSASPLARAELPGMDVSIRGAVSIARRAQDPLAELVKISPRSLGVGMYQHDVDQRRLEKALEEVVESVVNQVGVDLNSASPALLSYVAGIGPKLAERIVAYRDEHGPFTSRAELLDVPGVGPKSFQQAAGFLRVRGGSNPLDDTGIHPESYSVAQALLEWAGITLDASPDERRAAMDALLEEIPPKELAATLGTGIPTLLDIVEHLVRPGRDLRKELEPPLLRRDVLSLDDLDVGIELQGTVRNVVDFGAFVDIGLKRDGLLHRSQIPPGVRLRVGDVVRVRVARVEPERERISLEWPAA